VTQSCRKAAFSDPRASLRGSGGLPALLLAAALTLTGCGKLAGMLSFGGTDLEVTPKPSSEIAYRSLVEAIVPVAKGGGASTTTTRIDLTLKVRTTAAAVDGWTPMEAEVADGSQEVDGQARPGSLAGQKVSFKINAQRAFDGWQGVAFPTGAELFDLSLAGGRVRKGTRWTASARRVLLRLQEEISYDRTVTFEGSGKLGSEDAWRLTIAVAPIKKDLSAGGQLDVSGSGEVWLSKKDLRLLKGTEVLTGRLLNKKISREPGRFVHAIMLMDATLAPPRMPSALEALGADSGEAAARPAGPAVPGPSAAPGSAGLSAAGATTGTMLAATGTMAERLVFVSHATGKREIWSVAADGTGKRCLSGFADEHWSPAMDSEGRTLVCASQRSSGTNVWAIDLVGGERAALSEFGEQEDIEVQWCNGGQRAVFLRKGRLWSVHRDGYNVQSFAVGGRVVQLAAANSTSQVAVVTNELNQNKIVVVDVSSGAVREMFEGDGPAWSVDGGQLAYRGTDSVSIANADGSGARQLLKGTFGDGPLLWEPTGKRIAVTKLESDQADIYLVEAVANGKITRVTFRGGTVAAISPTGDRVAYLREGDLWIAAADGNTQVQLTADGTTELPVWWGKHYVP